MCAFLIVLTLRKSNDISLYILCSDNKYSFILPPISRTQCQQKAGELKFKYSEVHVSLRRKSCKLILVHVCSCAARGRAISALHNQQLMTNILSRVGGNQTAERKVYISLKLTRLAETQLVMIVNVTLCQLDVKINMLAIRICDNKMVQE